MTIAERAAQMAGNWRKADNFCWYEKPGDADNWTLYHYLTRDSGLLAESNAAAIEHVMRRYIQAGCNVHQEHFSHWACGWVDALAVRVYDKRGKITNAFAALDDLLCQMEQYPVLNEDDYSRREYEATLWGIADCARCCCETDLTSEQAADVYHWFSRNNDSALEASDDGGAYPEESDMREALSALGLLQAVE